MFGQQWCIATDPVYNFCFLCIHLIWLISNFSLLTVFLSSSYTSLENIIDRTFIHQIYPSNTIWRSMHWPCKICTPHRTKKIFLLHEYCLFKAREINYSHIKVFLSAVNPSFTMFYLYDLLFKLDKEKVIVDLHVRTKKTKYIILHIKQVKIDNLTQKIEWSFKRSW